MTLASRAQLEFIAERSNELVDLLGKYFGGMFDAEIFRKEARAQTDRLRRELDAAGYRIDESGRPVKPPGMRP